MNYRILLLAPLAAVVFSVSAASLRMPQGWFTSQNSYPTDPANMTPAAAMNGYEVGIDPSAGGAPTLTIRSVSSKAQGPISAGSAYQSVLGYAGKRVRFSGELRAEGVRGWAGLYLGEGFGHLMIDVTAARGRETPLPKGSAVPADGSWHDMSVVVEVPAEATHLGLGVGLAGEGQVWARGLRFEVVGPEVAPTTTPIGIDLEQARRFYAASLAETAKLPPSPLRNAALD
ncbi:hypothetical protein [Roseateles sp. P5_E7]